MSSMETSSGAAKAPRRRKTETAASVDAVAKPKRASRKAAQPPPSATPPISSDALSSHPLPHVSAPSCTDEQWRAMVSEAAYLKAERRGFVNGTPEQDWLEAERELRSRMA